MNRYHNTDIQKIYNEVCKILEINYVPLSFDQYSFDKDIFASYWTPIQIAERFITTPCIRLNRIEINNQLKYDIVLCGELGVYAQDKEELYILLIIHELTHAQRDYKNNYEVSLSEIDIVNGEHTEKFNTDARINLEKCKSHFKCLQYLEEII